MCKPLLLDLLEKNYVLNSPNRWFCFFEFRAETCIARYFYILFVKVTGHYCPLIMVGMGTLEKLNFLHVYLLSLEVTYPPIRTQSIVLHSQCKILRFRFWGGKCKDWFKVVHNSWVWFIRSPLEVYDYLVGSWFGVTYHPEILKWQPELLLYLWREETLPISNGLLDILF